MTSRNPSDLRRAWLRPARVRPRGRRWRRTAACGRNRRGARHPAGGRRRRTPGLTSALGILQVDLRHDFLSPVLPQARTLNRASLGRVRRTGRGARRLLSRASTSREDRRALELSLDLRYYGQTPYLNLRLPAPPADAAAIADDRRALRRDHTSASSATGCRPDVASVEIVNARVARARDARSASRVPDRRRSWCVLGGTSLRAAASISTRLERLHRYADLRPTTAEAGRPVRAGRRSSTRPTRPSSCPRAGGHVSTQYLQL